MNKKTIMALLLIALCLCGCDVLSINAEANLTDAEANLTDSETELTEAETSQESHKALSDVIMQLLAELREERRFQRDQFELLAELLQEREKPSYTWVWVLLAAIVGLVVAVVALRRRERTVVMMLPSNQAQGRLPAGDMSIIPYLTQDAIQFVDLGQEIIIE